MYCKIYQNAIKLHEYVVKIMQKGGFIDRHSFVTACYDTDRTKIKTLAFVCLEANGNVAILSGNALTYVLIEMKSPADENITSLVYNG